MNIVAWLETLQQELAEAGQSRLAELIDRIPDLTHDNKKDQVEALLPEAIASARALKNQWLEIFFRHWEMRNRLSNQGEGETALADVVALLELAHRKENLSCPQSVCTTHDISGCYANVDGPGWAEERKDVCTETLSRITPDWPCYTCLNREYVDALVDQKRYDAALERLDMLEAALMEAGDPADGRLYKDRAVILRELGNYDEALAFLDKADATEDFIAFSEGYRISSRILRAHLLALKGDTEAAFSLLPAWEELTPGDYAAWAHTTFALLQSDPESNDWGLGKCLQLAVNHTDRMKAHRNCLSIARLHAEAALARGAVWTAGRALAAMEAHLPRLRAPHGADSLVAEIKAKIAAAEVARATAGTSPSPGSALPVAAEHLLEWLEELEQRNPEQEAQWMLEALKVLPDDVDLRVRAAEAMQACEAVDEAVAVLKGGLGDEPERNGFLFSRLLLLYIESGREAETLALAADIEEDDPGLAHWARASLARDAGRWAELAAEARNALAHLPGNRSLQRMLVHGYRELQDFGGAVAVGKELVAALADEDEQDRAGALWELITSASAAADWRTVRETAAALDIAFNDTDGPRDQDASAMPPEEDWGWIRLRFYEDYEWNEYYARRTGPATARVVSIADPGAAQHVRDLVVFDPSYIEPLPEDEREREEYVVPHNALTVLESAGYTAWMCDGADPGEKAFDAFCEALEKSGYAVRLRARDGYSVYNPDVPESLAAIPDEVRESEDYDPVASGERLPGVYFAIASPPEATAKEAYALLNKLTKQWEHPLCCYSLAQAAGGDVKAQERIIEAYQL